MESKLKPSQFTSIRSLMTRLTKPTVSAASAPDLRKLNKTADARFKLPETASSKRLVAEKSPFKLQSQVNLRSDAPLATEAWDTRGKKSQVASLYTSQIFSSPAPEIQKHMSPYRMRDFNSSLSNSQSSANLREQRMKNSPSKLHQQSFKFIDGAAISPDASASSQSRYKSPMEFRLRHTQRQF